jgi:hypothetical protein
VVQARAVANASLIRSVREAAVRFYASWSRDCERTESWEPDQDELAFALGTLWDDENPAQNTALLAVFTDEYRCQLEHNGYPRQRPNQAFRVTSY